MQRKTSLKDVIESFIDKDAENALDDSYRSFWNSLLIFAVKNKDDIPKNGALWEGAAFWQFATCQIWDDWITFKDWDCPPSRAEFRKDLKSIVERCTGLDWKRIQSIGSEGISKYRFKRLVAATAINYGFSNLEQLLSAFIRYYIEFELDEMSTFVGKKVLIDHVKETYPSFDNILKHATKRPYYKSLIKSSSEPHFAPVLPNEKKLTVHDERIEELRHDYFERSHVKGKVKSFIKNTAHGYFKIHGEGGTGKSAIMADLVNEFRDESYREEYLCVYHFIVSGANTATTKNFIKSLYKQLTEFFDLSDLEEEYRGILNSMNEEWDEFINNLIKKSSQLLHQASREKLLIFVDGLDEISQFDQTYTVAGRNLFYIPKKLPENVFFIVSSRHDNQQEYEIDLEEKVTLGKTEPEHRAEIKEYIKNKLSLPSVIKWIEADEEKSWRIEGKSDEDSLLNTLCIKSDYTFLYLFHLFRKIEHFNIKKLPDGLKGIYKNEYQRLFTTKEHEPLKKRILSAFAVFRPDISIKRLSIFCGTNDELLVTLMKDWLDIRLIAVEEEDGDFYYKINHLTFHEFITKDVPDIKPLKFSAEPHDRLIDALYSSFTLTGKSIKFKPVLPQRLKEETFRHLYSSLKLRNKVELFAKVLRNKHILREFYALGIISNKIIIKDMGTICNAIKASGKRELAKTIALRFIKEIAEAENPIISVQDIHDGSHNTMSYFMDCFNEYNRHEER